MPLTLNQAKFSPVHAVGGYSHSQLLVRPNGKEAGVVLDIQNQNFLLQCMET